MDAVAELAQLALGLGAPTECAARLERHRRVLQLRNGSIGLAGLRKSASRQRARERCLDRRSHLLSAGDRDLYKNKWLRKHPDLDPSLYEYDTTRDALVVEFMRDHNIVRRSGES